MKAAKIKIECTKLSESPSDFPNITLAGSESVIVAKRHLIIMQAFSDCL